MKKKFRKKIFFLIFVIAISTLSFAQNNLQKPTWAENPKPSWAENISNESAKQKSSAKQESASKNVAPQTKSAPQTKKIQYKNLGFSGINNEAVKELRKKYLTTHKDWLYKTLENGQQYRIFVRNELEKQKMPAILEYLPLVESNYNPYAKSRSGATGLWQFMLNSISGLLEYNDYVDERLDPWKSTDAALKKLKDNYKTFGDWLLAITAYNCGSGALKKAIKNAGSRDFWYLRDKGFLSEQATSYVPKLLAIADAVENDKYYGVSFPQGRAWNGTTLETRAGIFDYVTVYDSVYLDSLSHELRIDKEELYDLNSALVKHVTPPHKKYILRFPEGMKDSATYALTEMGFKTSKN